MFEDVSILIPYKPDNGIRDINLNWIKKYYKKFFPHAEICVGISTDELFNRSRAINLAAQQATRNIFVIADGDIFYEPNVIKDSINHLKAAPWVIPFKKIVRISEKNSRSLIKADPTWPLEVTDFEIHYPSEFSHVGGLNIITRDHFMAVGGFDERFKGWGGEDDAFSCAVNTMCGQYKRLNHTIYHLWHPAFAYNSNPNGNNNLMIRELYYQANNDMDKMNQVISGSETIFKDKIKQRNSKECIYIVAVSNDTYAQHLAVMLHSLFENKESKNPVKIYVIDSHISVENKLLLARTTRKYKAKIYFKQIDPTLYREFPTLEYLTHETYYRISIPDLFDKINEVLYLDSDIIVKKDITELWNTDISQYYLGAVEDHWVKDSRNNDLFMPKDSKYFNAGVLLINLKKWREDNIKNKIIQFINNYSDNIMYCDQDALNAVLHDQWLSLDPQWNFQTDHIYDPNVKINPAIIHYTGGNKPWNSNHPLKEDYLQYKKGKIMLPKVSIIVPVYNTERYLRKCLDSLVNQTLKDLEVIVVNDGSPDNSQIIINEYIEKYPNKIKSIIKENGGLGDARNHGLQAAQGRYVGFVDSDDWVEPQMYETLYNAAIEGHDLIICDCIAVEDGEENGQVITGFSGNWLSKEQAIMYSTDPAFSCNKLFDRTLFNKVKFPKGWYEDVGTTPILMTYSNSVSYVQSPLYYYRQRPDSIIKSQDKRTLEVISAWDRVIEKADPKYMEEAVFTVARSISIFIDWKAIFAKEFMKFAEKHRAIIENNKYYQKAVKNNEIKDLFRN
ncbi:glycosyltransferase [Neobacillus cucumis]|uniref:glycosyltransferase n=1 Tax=Neobacillus cucumis TaxID=1740721 RepID=UPI00196685A0|nr:glycosyltransferase [Neobacillus cucumis]MBM7653825.1 lipopolysaccharide biosynthesis glycosyltransferase [Neobacillus cucumis]